MDIGELISDILDAGFALQIREVMVDGRGMYEVSAAKGDTVHTNTGQALEDELFATMAQCCYVDLPPCLSATAELGVYRKGLRCLTDS